MRRTAYLSGAIAVALLAVVSMGCQPSPEPAPAPAPAPPESTVGDPHMGHEHEHMSEDPEEVRAALAGLSASDRESAERQRICPVSGELLGSMGEPIKLDVEGREVWICCAGCERPLRDNPEEHLAKLNDG
jgi:hypothetical protein